MINKIILTTTVAFLGSLSIVAAQDLDKISIGVSSSSIPAAGPRIAKEMGLFEKHGLDATITPMESGSVATMGLISGSLDFISSAPTDVVVSNVRGQDLVSVASVYRGFGAVMVLAKTAVDKVGVEETATVPERLRALNGLVIATPSATSTYTFAAKPSADANGASIRLTYMAQPAMIAALESGAIDGFVASAPYYTQPVLRGTGVMWINGPKGEFPAEFSPANAVTLNTTRAFAQENPDVVKRAAAVFAEFSESVTKEPEAVKAAISKLFPELNAETVDLLFETDSMGFASKPLTEEMMAQEISFVKASGVDLATDTLEPASLMMLPN